MLLGASGYVGIGANKSFNDRYSDSSRDFDRVIFCQTRKKLLQIQYIAKVGGAFLLPLLLYAYLPLRWQAVVGEPMGFARFVDWVIAGRFRGALQLMAWLRDPTRYEVVGRLFLEKLGLV